MALSRSSVAGTSPEENNISLDEQVADLLQRMPGSDYPEVLKQEAILLALSLADSIARRYQGRGIDLDDLIQVARLGLVKAVNGYRPDEGAGFVAYAVPTISGEIKRHFRDCGWLVRPPRSMQELRARLIDTRRRLAQQLHSEPTDNELALAMGVPVAKVREARLSEQAYATSFPIEAVLAATEQRGYDTVVDRLALDSVLSTLSESDRRVLQLRFVEELSQRQIAAIIGVSQMQVSRILTRVLKELRGCLEEAELAS